MGEIMITGFGDQTQKTDTYNLIAEIGGKYATEWNIHCTHLIVGGKLGMNPRVVSALVSGMWILRQDYLTASQNAGYFIQEDPYLFPCGNETGELSYRIAKASEKRKPGKGAQPLFQGVHVVILMLEKNVNLYSGIMKAGGGAVYSNAEALAKQKSDKKYALWDKEYVIPSDIELVLDTNKIPLLKLDYVHDSALYTGGRNEPKIQEYIANKDSIIISIPPIEAKSITSLRKKRKTS